MRKFRGNEEIKRYNEGKSKSYVSDKICRFAYKLNLIHKFDKGNGLEELKKYEHSESGKPWKPPKSLFMLVLILDWWKTLGLGKFGNFFASKINFEKS